LKITKTALPGVVVETTPIADERVPIIFDRFGVDTMEALFQAA
jgi:hypothetical protein